MTIFSRMIEDPMYDEEGVLVDEDSEWEDMDEQLNPDELGITFDPYDTVNS